MSRGKILIIDDDLDILETTGELLKFEGYEIFCAPSTEEGLRDIAVFNPDLIILDLVFPETDELSFSVAESIKGDHPDLPIFIITAINREFALGGAQISPIIDEFLVKPVDIQHLISLIEKHKTADSGP